MDKFFNSTFDALTNVVPGAFFLAALTLLDPSFQTVDDLISKANDIDLGGGAFIIMICYVIGFAIGPIGKTLYQKVGFYLWPMEPEASSSLSISDKFILVREYSPTNFKYIESWNMFCTLAHNLALTTIALFVVSLLRIFVYKSSSVLLFVAIALLSVIGFFLFLKRAVVFRSWAIKYLNAAIATLNLNKKDST